MSGLTIGSLTLTPAFNASIKSYTCETTNSTNKISATAAAGAEIVITVGDQTVENEGSATWADGENVLTVKVTESGKTATSYVVTVTKT